MDWMDEMDGMDGVVELWRVYGGWFCSSLVEIGFSNGRMALCYSVCRSLLLDNACSIEKKTSRVMFFANEAYSPFSKYLNSALSLSLCTTEDKERMRRVKFSMNSSTRYLASPELCLSVIVECKQK